MRFALILAVVLFSCSQASKTPQQKAEASVTEYLKKYLNDPSSYKPVEFGKLEPIKVDTAYIHEGRQRELSVKDGLLAQLFDPKLWDSLAKATSDSIHKIGAWQIEHRYRAKNGFGALMVSDGLFYLDSSFHVTNKLDDK